MAAPAPRRTRRTRQGLAATVTAVALSLLTFPAIATASPPTTTSDIAYSTNPPPITVGAATVDFNILFSTLVGARGDLTYRGPGGTLTGIEGFAEMDGNTLVGEYFLVDVETGEPGGFAEYELTFTPAGDVESSERVTRDGNHRTVAQFTEQPMLVSGHLTMPDGTVFQVADAEAQRFTADIRTTDPRATILDGTETFVEANWMVDGTPVTFRGNVTALDSAGVVFLYTDEGEVIGLDRPVLADDRMTASFVLDAPDGSVAGTADVELDITTLGSSTSLEVTEFSRRRVVTDDISVKGRLRLTLDGVSHDLSFADAEVIATRSSWHGIQYPFADDTEG